MPIGYPPRGAGGERFTWQWLAPTRRLAIAARPALAPASAVDDERGERPVDSTDERGERPVDSTDERGERPVDSTADALETLRRVYVAAVSHELLTPLTIIKGHVELLADPAIRHDAALAEPALRAIEAEVDRLPRPVGNRLDSTRVSAR